MSRVGVYKNNQFLLLKFARIISKHTCLFIHSNFALSLQDIWNK